MKKGPLSKKEKAYIAKNYQDTTPNEIADLLDRSVHMVDKQIMKLSFTANKEKQEEELASEALSPPTESNPLYARNVAENGVVRSTIGTQAASMAADESRAKRKSPEVSPRYSKHIHEIKKR